MPLLFLFLLLLPQFIFSQEIRLTVQPLLTISENLDFKESGDIERGFQRARVDLRLRESAWEGSLRGRLMLDFAESDVEDILKVALVEMRNSSALRIRFGQYKSPFGYESQYSSSSLFFIDRGQLSSYIRGGTGAGGFLRGFGVYGSIGSLSYSADIFDNSVYTSDGKDFGDFVASFFAIPTISLSYEINRKLLIYGASALPYYSNSGGESVRVFLNSFALHYSGDRQEAFIEQFVGADSSLTYDYTQVTAEKGVESATALSYSYIQKLQSDRSLRASLRFEHLYGSTLNTRYTLTYGLSWYYSDDLFVHINYGDRYDSSFDSRNRRRIGLFLNANFSQSIRG